MSSAQASEAGSARAASSAAGADRRRSRASARTSQSHRSGQSYVRSSSTRVEEIFHAAPDAVVAQQTFKGRHRGPVQFEQRDLSCVVTTSASVEEETERI